MYTREDISSLPVLDAKFQEVKSDYLGPLIVIPEMVAKKIKAMKDNKSPGVDGVSPKLLIETVEQISIPLVRVFNLNGKKKTSYRERVWGREPAGSYKQYHYNISPLTCLCLVSDK